MEVLELETFSLARALTQEKEGTYLIIDIGSRATNLVLVEGGVVKVNRNLNSGGNEITSTLAEGLNISWERAESLKKGDKDFLNIKESSLVFPALEIIGNEATRIFNAYQAKNGDKRPDGVILSGGTAKMKGLDIYFANVLNTSVTLGNPWKGIRYNDALKSSIERMGTSYSVALGLALGGVDAYERS
jgi:type IV pilus assembly protein PilM